MVSPQKRLLFVEGGGDQHPRLATECRRAFSKLLDAAGVKNKPRIVVCGGRQQAYEQFVQDLRTPGVTAWLLIDAEAVLAPDGSKGATPPSPWAHLKARKGDGWDTPNGATDEHVHLMAVCMETWLLADHDAIKRVFGAKTHLKALPPEGAALERAEKAKVFTALEAATKGTSAGPYGKGDHSFLVLEHVSPAKLAALPWARRWLQALGGSP